MKKVVVGEPKWLSPRLKQLFNVEIKVDEHVRTVKLTPKQMPTFIPKKGPNGTLGKQARFSSPKREILLSPLFNPSVSGKPKTRKVILE